jgi:hypothetical protein
VRKASWRVVRTIRRVMMRLKWYAGRWSAWLSAQVRYRYYLSRRVELIAIAIPIFLVMVVVVNIFWLVRVHHQMSVRSTSRVRGCAASG